MTEKQTNDGIISFLSSILRGNDEVKENFAPLVRHVKLLADEVLILAKAVSGLTNKVREHSIALEDVYSVQAQILQHLSKDAADHVVKINIPLKNKEEKPN